MFYHHSQGPTQQSSTPSPGLASNKLQQQQQDAGGWGRHPGLFTAPPPPNSGSGMGPYGGYPPPPQQHHPHNSHHPHHPHSQHPSHHPHHSSHPSFSSSHNASHPSPSPLHQQVGGLLVGNLAASVAAAAAAANQQAASALQNGGGGNGGGGGGNGMAHQSPQPQRTGNEDTVWWQQQLVKLSACRQASAPHHRARAAAITGRMNNNKSAISIQDPNRPPSTKPYLSNGYSHSKNGSMTNLHSAQDDVSDDGMPVGRGADHPGGIGAPATPRSASARPAEERAKSTDPAWDGLDLGGMHLKALSQSLFSFSHITALYINYNNLTSLPPAISELRKLKTLDVTGNQLTAVPAELGMLVTLKELFLFDNQLSSLPPELGTLHNLDVIGIAGNPLPDNLKLTLERDGTAALISYLRDSCPVPLPPPDREWITIEADNLSLEAPREQETFTLLCYNILAERAATSQMYGYTPSWALAWDYRKELILQEIMGCGSDFICLQEVEDERFHDTFLQNLKSEGYEGAFFPKTRSRTMSTDEKRRVDGCATFWKASKYNLVESRVVEFNQVALQRPDMRKSDDMFNRVMSKDHIAVVCLLENATTGSRLVVANVHMEWSPTFRDVKLVQAAMLMEEVEKISDQFARFPPKLLDSGERGPAYSDATKIPLVVCGDFNSVPVSGVYEFLANGTVPKDHEDFMDHVYGAYTTDGLSHKFNLKSAYSNCGTLPMTNFVPTFQGAIDHIWYSQDTLAVTSLLGEVDRTYLNKVVGFPNAHFPSDHVPIFADFKLKAPPPSARAVSHGDR